VGSGKNLQGNLPSADGAGGRSTVAKNARRAPGFSTATGVLLLPNNGPYVSTGGNEQLKGEHKMISSAAEQRNSERARIS
jgi:hypothetical protein